MTDSYTKVGWKNNPDHTTPVSADNLGTMDEGIKKNNTGLRTAETDIDDLKTAMGNTSIAGIGDGTVTGAVSTINTNLGDKVGGEISTYTTIENVAYDSTNKKLMLKVEGADTPIPFSAEIQSATQVSSGDRTLSATCKKGEVFVATGAKYGGVITYENATVLREYYTGSFGTAIVKAQANGTITVGNWYGTAYMYKLNG